MQLTAAHNVDQHGGAMIAQIVLLALLADGRPASETLPTDFLANGGQRSTLDGHAMPTTESLADQPVLVSLRNGRHSYTFDARTNGFVMPLAEGTPSELVVAVDGGDLVGVCVVWVCNFVMSQCEYVRFTVGTASNARTATPRRTQPLDRQQKHRHYYRKLGPSRIVTEMTLAMSTVNSFLLL